MFGKPKNLSLEDMQKKFYDTSLDLVDKSGSQVWQAISLKVPAMQSLYLTKNSNLYSDEEMVYIKYFLDASLLKFRFAAYSLEQLYAMRYGKVMPNLLSLLEHSIDALDVSKGDEFLQSFTLEQFLFQGNSFLDFTMLHLSHLLKTNHEGAMTKSKFYTRLDKAQLSEKASRVRQHFDTRIFDKEGKIDIYNPTNWGSLVKSLRDKIAHRDLIKLPQKEGKIINEILRDWPTLQGMLYTDFCQAIQNGMFSFYQDLTSIIFDLEWKAGPYKEGMWK